MKFLRTSLQYACILSLVNAEQIPLLTQSSKQYVPQRSIPKEYDYKIQAKVADDFYHREVNGAENSLKEQKQMLKEQNHGGYGYETVSGKRSLSTYTYTCSHMEDYNYKGPSMCDTSIECIGERVCLDSLCWGDHGCDEGTFAAYIARIMPNYGQTDGSEDTYDDATSGGWQATPLNYQYYEGYNRKYISYNSDDWVPQTTQYMEWNNDLKVSSFNSGDNCGDCLRGGYVYCTQSNLLGSTYEEGSTWDEFYPAGVCCESKSNCPQRSDSAYKCSSEIEDDYYQYQICPVNIDSCKGAEESIDLGSKGAYQSFAINDLMKGEVCNYRVKSECDSPAFRPTSETDQFNITYIEYEEDGQDLWSKEKSKQDMKMLEPDTEAIYNYLSISEKQAVKDSGLVELSHIEIHVDSVRKGQYDLTQMGWKAYNEEVQTEDGKNGNTEEFWDPDDKCKTRNMIVTVTALEDDASVRLAFKVEGINSAFYGLSVACAAFIGALQFAL